MVVLKNGHLVARFDDDGRLIHLSAPRGPNLVEQVYCKYCDRETHRIITDEEDGEKRSPSGAFGIDRGVWQTTRVDVGESAVSVARRSPHLEVELRYALDAGSSLLEVHSLVRGTGEPGSLVMPATPGVRLADGFVDTFEDEGDLYFDGAELGEGHELPCWRVFFRGGRRTGLLLATRCKEEMARFNLIERGFDLWTNSLFNYSTSGIMALPPLDPTSRRTWEARFEIGPWSKARHEAILRAGRLDEPVNVRHPRPQGQSKRELKGEVIYAARAAGASVASASYRPKKWQLVRVPWAQKGKALFANTGILPPAIKLDPKLSGPHRVLVGIGNGCGATLRIVGESQVRYRMGPPMLGDRETAFALALAGRQKPAEVDFGALDLTGKKLEIGRMPNLHLPAMIDYVRFEELSPGQARRWAGQEQRGPVLPLSGFNDIPDIAILTNAVDPDPAAYEANVWEHANCKFEKIFWRIDGQCSDYPSKLNTMRYVSAKVHGVFTPQAKAYGRALRKAGLLRLAVDAASRYGVGLWGWMRFNSYMGNVQSDFYKSNPQYWEEWEAGRKGGKLCLAHKAVRDHKIGILVEAAKYGLDGLCLGFLRHPPVLLYARVLRESYRRKYGKLPPRDPEHPDAHHRTSLPDRGDDEYLRWWQHRAKYLTKFGRELKKALDVNGLGHIKIAIWVRSHHCLFDGIDLSVWLEEGLCDEVVSQAYAISEERAPDLYWEDPEWKAMVQLHVPLVRTIGPNAQQAKRDLPRILSGHYDGICTYESDYTVLDTDFIELYRKLRARR